MSTSTTAGGFEAVLARAASGDGRAFEELVEPLVPRLRGYLRGIGRDETDDLLDDVLLAVFANLGRFEGADGAFRSWVFAIAHNRAVDHHRRRRRRPAPVDPADCEPARGWEPSAESAAVDHVAEQELLEVLAYLAPAQRQALLLRTVADLSIEQTAAVIGRSPGAVKLLQHRAVTALRRRIRGVDDEA